MQVQSGVRDLVAARAARPSHCSVHDIGTSRKIGEDLPRDDKWHDRAILEISLIDGMSSGQVDVTAREFGMRREPDGSFAVRIEPRKAMIPYVLGATSNNDVSCPFPS